MRKTATTIALALALAAAPSVAAALPAGVQQESQAKEQKLTGSLHAVNLDDMEITVADTQGSETTVSLTEDTTVSGPDGQLQVTDLQGKEGSDVIVRYVKDGEGLEALSVQLVA